VSLLGMALVAGLLQHASIWLSLPAAVAAYLALLLLTRAVLPAELVRAVAVLPMPGPLQSRLRRIAESR